MKLKRRLPIILLLLLGTLVCFLACYNHYWFKSFAYDYANYNRGFWEYAHFKSTPNTLLPGKSMSFFQDHFSFTFIFLVPFFWLFNWLLGSYTILVLQSVFISWGGWAVYRLVWEKSEKIAPALVSLLLYFLMYGRFASFATDSNLMIILSSFVPVFLLYFQRGKIVSATLCFLFLILGRESVPLWTFFIALMLCILNWKNPIKRKWSMIYMATSIIYFVLVMKVFIPLTENPDSPFSLFEYSRLGETPGEALVFLLTNPLESLNLLVSNFNGNEIYNDVKSEFAYIYLLSGGLLLLFRPLYLIPFVPIIAQKMFHDSPIRWGTTSYYGIEFVSILPIFIGYVLADIKWKAVRLVVGIVCLVACICITLEKIEYSNRAIPWPDGNKTNVTKKEFWRNDIDADRIRKILGKIPPEANVAADTWLAPHLAQRDKISYFPDVIGEGEYFVFFKDRGCFWVPAEEYDEAKKQVLENPSIEVVDQNKDVILLKRK